jgi:hypothetical protein
MTRLLIAACLVFLLAGSALCYSPAQPRFEAFGGLSHPMGDFGDDSGTHAGLATTGLCVGAEVSIPIGSPGLYGTIGGLFIRNGVDEDELANQLRSAYYGYDVSNLSVDIGSYVNIPLMGGIRYSADMSAKSSFYVEGNLGLNLVMGPKEEMSMTVYDDDLEDYINVTSEINWDVATSLCIAFGGGVAINDKFLIGLRYVTMGEVSVDGDGQTCASAEGYGTYCQSSTAKLKQPISMLLLTAGVRF